MLNIKSIIISHDTAQISGHSSFKGVEIAELCEELESCDISNGTVMPNNVADSVQTSLSRSNSGAAETENGKTYLTFTTLLANSAND